MWLKKFSGLYGFEIFFFIAVILLGVIFFYNLFSGSKGTYTNHNKMIMNLIQKEVVPKRVLKMNPSQESIPQKKVSFESKGETECRRAIEKITGKPFPRARPNFLKNGVSGHNLELDCFNSDLNIAIEYNGEQHYKFTPYFFKNKEAFYNVKYRDEMKQRLCDSNGVKLLIVPYTVNVKDIENFIRQNL